jgi:hypothetical protein
MNDKYCENLNVFCHLKQVINMSIAMTVLEEEYIIAKGCECPLIIIIIIRKTMLSFLILVRPCVINNDGKELSQLDVTITVY